jgi:hypothetical protein
MLLSGNLHVFLSPQSLDTLVINPPATSHQLLMRTRAAKTGPLAGDPSHLSEQLLFDRRAAPPIALRVAVLTQYPTGTPL